MTIEELLKRTNARITFEDKWMYFDEDTNEWVVCQKKAYARETVVLSRGSNLGRALVSLEGDSVAW